MKFLSVSSCAVLCLIAACQPCISQTSAWNGSWKADPSSLKYDGPSFSMATDSTGFTTTRDGKAMPKVVCDGKPQKSPNGMMVTCSKSATGYTIGATKDGKQVRKTSISVSADGKTRTSKSEIFPPDGAPFTMTSVAKRVSGGPGPAGEWKEIKVSSSDDKGVLTIAINGDNIAFKETDSPKPVTCKLDGTDTKFGGGLVSIKLADPHTLKVTYKDSDGKVRRNNTFALGKDGKMITETDVTPAPSASNMSLSLHKM
jgi:hypothetical protein